MEGGPEFRIVGSAPAEKKEEARKELEQAFSKHFESLSSEEQEELKKLEFPKSEKERAIIDFANAETDRLMQKAGVEPYDIPQGNYHIVPFELYRKHASVGSAATASYGNQGIVFNAEKFRANPVLFGRTVLHETLHLKGHYSIELVEKGEKVEKTSYRKGVSALSVQKRDLLREGHEHFEGLHEAIVSYQAKKSLPRLLDLPELAEDKAWLESAEAKEIRKKLAEKERIPEDDIVWVGRKENDWGKITYYAQRATLDYVLKEIQKQFPEKFQGTDEVFEEFLKAHFTGHLLGIAHLVEGTFGRDGFRELGNMGEEDNSAVLVQGSLRRMRTRQIRQRE